ALRAGYRLLERFPDGVWWIELESLEDPELLSQHVGSTLKQKVGAGNTPLETLVGYLRDKNLLLILNNCEHLIDPAAQFVDGLLHRCPQIIFLATSREVLGVEGERALLVASLDFPKSGAAYDETELMAFESVRLFCERAAEALPDFQVSAENLDDIARICRQLDGIPLAIELAAARAKALRVKQILGRLEDRFSLLTSGRRTALPRHQTLRATLDWSYDLLATPERQLFNRLAVFSGGWDLEAAESVCAVGGTKAAEVLDLLTQLTEKSMVLIDRQPSVTPRYRLLESMRQYALEKMIASDQVETLRQRHLDHYLGVARKLIVRSRARAAPEMLDRMERDHDNLRSAFEWSLNEAAPLAKKLELAIHLGYFWDVRGYSLEGLDRLGALIQRLDRDQDDLQTAHLLNIAAAIAYKKSDYITSKAYWERCLETARSGGPEGRALEAQALMGLANTATEIGDYESPVPLFTKAHDICELLGDQEGMGEALRNLGWAYMRPGDLEMAAPALQTALSIHRRAGNNIAIASTLAGLGELAIRKGEYDEAVPFLEESLALRQAIGVKWGIGVSLGSLGWIALRKNDFQRARTYLGESLKVRRQIDDKGGMAWCLEKLGEMAQAEGRPEESILIFAAAAAMRTSIQSVIDPADVPAYEALQEKLRDSVGANVYQAAWERGKGLDMNELIVVALAGPEDA
ncbi:MAG: tetratricopeptide repeat protein, partial [Anaerolineales bacterium]